MKIKIYLIFSLLFSSSLLMGNTLSRDYSHISNGRKAFAENKFQEAISHYKKVSKESDLWSQSLEEMAWAHFRLNQHAEVLALTQTLLAFPLNQLSPYESYLLQGLTELKSCRYDQVFKTLQLFNNHQLGRIQALESIAEKHQSLDLAKSLIKKGRVGTQNISQVGSLLQKLPYLAYLDEDIQKYIASKEAVNLSERLSQLAQEELHSLKKIVAQLKLLKIEAEQRVVRDYESSFEKTTVSEFQKTNYNQLIFPTHDNQGTWIDELGQFEVAMKACNQLRRKL